MPSSSAFPREWRFNYRNIPASGTATIKVRLLELSSSRNLGISAASAHVTELTRTVNAAGPNLRMFVAFPQQDGQTIGEGYVMKVRFTASLGDGLTEAQLRSRFLVEIASQESGSLAGAAVQTPQTLPIIYNAAPGFHDYQFALPNLYNGVPDFLHSIRVTMNRPTPDPDLVTTREVRAQVTQPAVFVSINNPPEVDSDGKKFEIILPAVATPTPEQRSFVIEVETGSEATSVIIDFQDASGAATLINDGTPNPRIEGNHKFWRFLWTNMTEGQFSFAANVQTDGDPAPEASQTRNATVIFRQIVASNDADNDDDDDGLSDLNEATITALPATNSDHMDERPGPRPFRLRRVESALARYRRGRSAGRARSRLAHRCESADESRDGYRRRRIHELHRRYRPAVLQHARQPRQRARHQHRQRRRRPRARSAPEA